MLSRRVRLLCFHLARLSVWVLAALALSGAPARPLHASRFMAFAPSPSDMARPLSMGRMLRWNTFLGASGYDYAEGMALDAAGNIYVTGSSEAAWQGVNPPLHSYNGGQDAFVAKLDPSGALIWNTFLGQSGIDAGMGITLDASGNLYVVGISDDTWEGADPPLRDYTASYDVFVAKLSPSGNLMWNTFLGGTSIDQGSGIAVAGDGNIYVTGECWGTWQGTNPPIRDFKIGPDVFAAQLDASGTLLWNTFLGGDGADFNDAVMVYGDDNIYIVGSSGQTWQGSNPPLESYTASDDGFVAKLNPKGELSWTTFLGGAGDDYSHGIAFDGNGNVFVAGQSTAGWQGSSQPIRGYSASGDGFVAKLSPTGLLTWNTFLGGSGYEAATAVAVDASAIYVAGRSNAPWGSPAHPHSGGGDAFVVELGLDGSLAWNTFLGGAGMEEAFVIAPDGSGNFYVAGVSNATWGSPIRPYTESDDAFIAQIGGSDIHLPLLRR